MSRLAGLRSLLLRTSLEDALCQAGVYAQRPTQCTATRYTSGRHLHQSHAQQGADDQSSAASTSSAPHASSWKLEYEGPFSKTIRTLKGVSLATATMSLVGSPAFLYSQYGLGGSDAVKILGAVGFTTFGLFTTGLLQWFVGPYVHKLWYKDASGDVKVEMLSLFLQPRTYTFNVKDIQSPDSIAPLQTFEVNGRVMFVDNLNFPNKELLELLTPEDPYAMAESKPDKHDDE